ncbi:MAG: PspC domain-containing protein [Bacteroidetes bacterium]|nr:PspC domain-containing protein [Bacteroidota bacterium]MCB0844235.1 PspC domain-containing protein [Bacteroidota bacterium]
MEELIHNRRRRKSGLIRKPRIKKFNTKITRKKGSLTGVCEGLGEHVGISPLFFRLGFIATTIFSGLGLILYIILAIFLPMEESEESGLDGRFALDAPQKFSREDMDILTDNQGPGSTDSLSVCSICDTVSKPTAKFCHKCGNPL